MKEKKISVAEAKKHFSELLGKVAYGKEKVLITKRGRPMVKMIPAENFESNLGDVKGWLDNDDPFFKTINSIVRDREKHKPRVLKDN